MPNPMLYKYVKRRHHPLATADGRIALHRLVLYERIGPGTHPCHHCSAPVTWMPGGRTRPGALVVDHLDRNRRNNVDSNLVPSCHRCNLMQTERTVRDDELFVIRDGKRRRASWHTCWFCGVEFLFPLGPNKPTYGRYCSGSCRAKAPRKRQ